jgi:hypothetical protein
MPQPARRISRRPTNQRVLAEGPTGRRLGDFRDVLVQPERIMLPPTIRYRNGRTRQMTARRRRSRDAGAIVGATWLIGLGVIFLLQQTLDWSWGEAWPMFVIMAGIGTLVSTWASQGFTRRWVSSLGWPLLLIVAGTLLLLSTTGRLGIGPGDLVARWWPLAVIALGIWFLVVALIPRAAGGIDRVQLPLAGAPQASVTVRFGGGELSIGPARSGLLLDGAFTGIPGRYREQGPGNVELEPESPPAWPWWDRTPSWQVGVAADVPLDLRVDSGAAKVRLDLTNTRLRSLRIGTGASDTRVLLPRAAGETRVRAESGAASITFEVPRGVAARITSKMALGSSRIDEGEFPRAAGGWETPGYAAAENRVEVQFSGGVGQLQVLRGA